MRVASFAAALAAVLVLAGCGGTHATAEPKPHAHPHLPKLPRPGQFLSVDAASHSVTITLIASYDGANSGFNFDGYSRELMWTVPRGWTVHVICRNHGPLRHSCAVVRGASSGRPAFPGATVPQPTIGLEAGTSATFSFKATTPGVYRFVCLVQGHEAARMWDVFQVVRSGRPSVVSLLAHA